MLRRHPIFATLLLLPLACAAILGYALATFDLDRYRGELQERLSEALDLPVRLGKAELSFRGPAVAFADLQVGPPEGAVLRAERLLLRLDWREALRGRLTFSRILLQRPRIYILLTKEGKAFTWPDVAVLQSAEIRSLALRNGTLHLEDRRDPSRPFPVHLEEFKAEISGIAVGKAAWVHTSGRLRIAERASPLTVAGEIVPAGGSKKGELYMNLGAVIENFDPAPLLAHALGRLSSPLSGAGRLELTAEGSPKEGMRVYSRFAGTAVSGLLPWRKAPVPLRGIEGRGTWRTTEAGHSFDQLSLRVDDLSAEGALDLRSEGDVPWLKARLSLPPTSLRTLGGLSPEQWQGLVQGGTVQIPHLVFSGPLSALREEKAWARHLSGEAVLGGISGEIPGVGTVTSASARLKFAQDILQVQDGKGSFLDTVVTFAGAVERPIALDWDLLIQAEGAPSAGKLLEYLPAERRRGFTAAGAIPTVLEVSGRKDRLRLDLRADLKGVDAAWKDGLRKPAGTPAHLVLNADLTPDMTELAVARLKLPGTELLVRGVHQRGSDHNLNVSVDLKAADLAAIRPLVPVLEELRAEGGAHAHVELAGHPERLRYSGTVTLQDAGVHLGGIVADLKQTNGLLRITQERVEIERLSSRIGTSPLSVEGHLAGFEDPRIELRVKGRAIRAQDLVFTSPKAVLRDLDARLTIDRRHVGFAPVKVRLDGGTRAVVEGEVRNFDHPHVALDIRADQADIDEVIALWDAPETAASASPAVEEVDVTVRINARAERGKLGPLHFQQASGVVTWEKGVLSVYPLQFRSGPGECAGRVVVEDRAGNYFLTVSGHADRFDASSIYQELLDRRGLVTGTLRSDFFLEGELEKFRQTARGGVTVEVEKGVLRKFNSLAKVFSLLNVSQIFALQLPDMARDGMPFNRLAATFDLHQGVLRTEDFFIDSHAMNLSLVGSLDLKTEKLDMVLGLKPLRTVDKIVTRIPLAGWLLTGEEKALITAHFQIRGHGDDPEVRAVPITSLSEKAVGIFRRILGLPGHVVENVGEMVRRN